MTLRPILWNYATLANFCGQHHSHRRKYSNQVRLKVCLYTLSKKLAQESQSAGYFYQKYTPRFAFSGLYIQTEKSRIQFRFVMLCRIVSINTVRIAVCVPYPH